MTGEKRFSMARGAARDGAAAIDGFAQLLSSRRVGPRAVARALTEVREGCATLAQSLEDLEQSLRDLLDGDPEAARAAHLLLQDARTNAATLSTALGSHGKAAIDARARIALENLVVRIACEISGALWLADLLAAAASPRPTPLWLADILAERFRAFDESAAAGKPGSSSASSPPSDRRRPAAPVGLKAGRLIRVTVQMDAPVLLTGDNRVVSGLLEFAVLTAVRSGVETPAITTADRDGRIALRIGPAPQPFEGRQRIALFVFRECRPLAGDVARAVARLSGIELGIDESSGTVTITL